MQRNARKSHRLASPKFCHKTCCDRFFRVFGVFRGSLTNQQSERNKQTWRSHEEDTCIGGNGDASRRMLHRQGRVQRRGDEDVSAIRHVRRGRGINLPDVCNKSAGGIRHMCRMWAILLLRGIARFSETCAAFPAGIRTTSGRKTKQHKNNKGVNNTWQR